MGEGAGPRQQQDGGVLSLAEPNQALEPTANSVRCAPAVGGGSPRAFGVAILCQKKEANSLVLLWSVKQL